MEFLNFNAVFGKGSLMGHKKKKLYIVSIRDLKKSPNFEMFAYLELELYWTTIKSIFGNGEFFKLNYERSYIVYTGIFFKASS